jgi:hypothetical protein
MAVNSEAGAFWRKTQGWIFSWTGALVKQALVVGQNARDRGEHPGLLAGQVANLPAGPLHRRQASTNFDVW